MIKERMLYRRYKEHFSDCETVPGTYEKSTKSIIVIIPEGRMKPSGVRGKHFYGFELMATDENEKKMLVCLRAVSLENALKQISRDPDLNRYNWQYSKRY